MCVIHVHYFLHSIGIQPTIQLHTCRRLSEGDRGAAEEAAHEPRPLGAVGAEHDYLSLSLYIYIYMCVYIYIYTHTHVICIYIYTYVIFVYIYIYICIYVYMYTCSTHVVCM